MADVPKWRTESWERVVFVIGRQSLRWESTQWAYRLNAVASVDIVIHAHRPWLAVFVVANLRGTADLSVAQPVKPAVAGERRRDLGLGLDARLEDFLLDERILK